MNIFANIIFLFIFLLSSLWLRIPNISNDHLILQKVIIALIIFCFQFLLEFTDKANSGCKIQMRSIAKSSFDTAILAALGFAIYTDLKITENKQFTTNHNILLVTFTVTVFVAIVKAFLMIFGERDAKCDKLPQKTQNQTS